MVFPEGQKRDRANNRVNKHIKRLAHTLPDMREKSRRQTKKESSARRCKKVTFFPILCKFNFICVQGELPPHRSCFNSCLFLRFLPLLRFWPGLWAIIKSRCHAHFLGGGGGHCLLSVSCNGLAMGFSPILAMTVALTTPPSPLDRWSGLANKMRTS